MAVWNFVTILFWNHNKVTTLPDWHVWHVYRLCNFGFFCSYFGIFQIKKDYTNSCKHVWPVKLCCIFWQFFQLFHTVGTFKTVIDNAARVVLFTIPFSVARNILLKIANFWLKSPLLSQSKVHSIKSRQSKSPFWRLLATSGNTKNTGNLVYLEFGHTKFTI